MNIDITFTRTLVQTVTVTVDDVIRAIGEAKVGQPGWLAGIREELAGWATDRDDDPEIPQGAWDAIADYALGTLSERDPVTEEDSIELDEVTVSD